MDLLKRNGFWIGILAVFLVSVGLGVMEVWGSYDVAMKARKSLQEKEKKLNDFERSVPKDAAIEAHKSLRLRAEDQFRKTRDYLAALEKEFDDAYFSQIIREDSRKIIKYARVTPQGGEAYERSGDHFEDLERRAATDPETKRKLEAMFQYTLVKSSIDGRLEGILRQLIEARFVADPPKADRGAPPDIKAYAQQVFAIGHPQKDYGHPRQVVEAQKRFWVLLEAIQVARESLKGGAGEIERIEFKPVIPSELKDLAAVPAAGTPTGDPFFRRIRFSLSGRGRFSTMPDLIQQFFKSPLTFRLRGAEFTRAATELRADGGGDRRPGGRDAAANPQRPGEIRFKLELEVLDWEIPEAPWQR